MQFLRPAFGYAVIVLVGALMVVALHFEINGDYGTAKKRYFDQSQSDSKAVARQVEDAFRSIYENIRTITYLPGVMDIDRHGTNLSEEARTTIQQIYNNLASNVSISEVYIVPVDFNPDRIDPVTGKVETPILEFDQLIVNAQARADAKAKGNQLDHAKLSRSADELETYEHRELARQLAWFKMNFPNTGSFEAMSVPFISSEEVITCDNTQFVHTHEDADRSGIIFSAPFYGSDGELRGSVSAIVLTSVLSKMLPNENFTIVNASRGFSSRQVDAAEQASRIAPYLMASPDLIYSETIPLHVNDEASAWHLWAGSPNTDFTDSIEVESIKDVEQAALGTIAILTLCGIGVWTIVVRTIATQRKAAVELETRVEERTAEIHHLATHDTLTGLPNRRLLADRMDELLAGDPENRTFAVHCIDLDRFKPVNDTLGHPIGDELLKVVALRLKGCSQQGALVARLGGDEFMVLQADAKSRKEAAQLAQRIITTLSQDFHIEGHRVNIGASVGFALYPDDGQTSKALIRNADLALYAAKADGRGTSRSFEAEMYDELQQAALLEGELREAIGLQQFVLHYQPLHDLKTGAVTGYEALVRWNHLERGLLMPAEFIRVAEETGLIRQLGTWILDQACFDAASWPGDLRVSVNISPVQFDSGSLLLQVMSAVGAAGLSPSRLELEITESLLLAESDANVRTLHGLRRLGVKIAMDDFGTGYSALRYLRSFPFDRIKIDRSFIGHMVEDEGCRAIVKAIAELASTLGISTTAEGVETEAHAELVSAAGCTDGQGYFFGKPAPVSEIAMLAQETEVKVA